MSRIINDAEIIAAIISSNLRDAIINFFYVITHLFVLFLSQHRIIVNSLCYSSCYYLSGYSFHKENF